MKPSHQGDRDGVDHVSRDSTMKPRREFCWFAGMIAWWVSVHFLISRIASVPVGAVLGLVLLCFLCIYVARGNASWFATAVVVATVGLTGWALYFSSLARWLTYFFAGLVVWTLRRISQKTAPFPERSWAVLGAVFALLTALFAPAPSDVNPTVKNLQLTEISFGILVFTVVMFFYDVIVSTKRGRKKATDTHG